MLTRCSRDLRYQFVSRTYAEMLGRQPADIAGKAIVEIMGEEGFETIRPYVETVLQGTRVEFECDIRFNRDRCSFVARGVYARHRCARPRARVDCVDARHRRTQASRRSSHAARRHCRFVGRCDHQQESGRDHHVVECRCAERMFGYAAAEAIGQSIAIIIPPERRDEEIEIIQRLSRG